MDMKDEGKTKKQLIDELTKLRRRNAELEASEIELKKAEEALRENQARLAAIVDKSPIPTAIGDSEGSIISFQ